MELYESALAESWWAVALRGVVAILFGLTALFLPGLTLLALVAVFAAYCLADGLFSILMAARNMRRKARWLALLVGGLLSLAAAVVSVMWPGITAFAFLILVAVWAVATGVAMVVAGFRVGKERGRFWFFVSGIISIAWGLLLIAAPIIGMLVLVWWFGAFALVLGGSLLVLAFKLRAARDDITVGLSPRGAG